MAIATDSLVTLAVLKANLGITNTTDDAVLEDAIDRASSWIQRYCGRNLVNQRYYEWRDTFGQDRITVKHNPISDIRFVGVGGDNVLSIDSTISTDAACTVSVLDNWIALYRVSSTGTETHTQVNFSNHDTTSEIVAHINTITGFSASLLLNVPSRYLRKMAGRDIKQQTLLLEAPTEGLTDYAVDFDTGVIYGPSLHRYKGMLIDYYGGFSAIPYDIEMAAVSMATRLYRGRQRDPGVSSESLGGYSYSLRSVAELDDEVRSALESYRRLR